MTKQEIAKIRHQRLRDDEQGITHPHARTVDDLLAHIGMLERLLAESKSYAAGLTTSDK